MSFFTRRMLLLFSAPIIWAMHFLAVYGFTGILCARPALQQTWLGIGAMVWGIGLASAVAVAAIAAIHRHSWRACRQNSGPDFIAGTGAALGLLSVIAVVWETLPLFLVPPCG